MVTLDLSPDGATITLIANVNSFQSSLNGAQQHSILPGSKWAASFTWANRKGADARKLRAQIASLLGPVGILKIKIPEPNFGTASGSGIVVSGDAGDSFLTSGGWTPSDANLFKAGDWVEVNQQAFQITADVSSDGSGLATINIAPPIRRDLTAGQSINGVNPSLYMRLTNADGAAAALSPAAGSPVYALSIEALEID